MLSPEAVKAQENSLQRQRAWWPWLARTSDKLTLHHARKNKRGQRHLLVEAMTELGWLWDSKAGYYYADLTVENLEAVLDVWTANPGTNHARLCLNLSDGVKRWREELC